MPILDIPTLATYTNRPSLADPSAYDPDYLAAVIADVQDQITQYLKYDPVLAVIAGESGKVDYCTSGPYSGQYLIRLSHAPLLSAVVTDVIAGLTLSYGLASIPNVVVDLTVTPLPITLIPEDGCLYISMVTPLGGLYWGDAALLQESYYAWNRFGATILANFTCSYVAGFATGFDDPTKAGNISYGALPMPAAITQAAVLLCRERIALDDAANQQTTNASAGSISYIRTQTQEVKYQTFSQTSTSGVGSQLGAGTSLSQAAMSRLNQYRRIML